MVPAIQPLKPKNKFQQYLYLFIFVVIAAIAKLALGGRKVDPVVSVSNACEKQVKIELNGPDHFEAEMAFVNFIDDGQTATTVNFSTDGRGKDGVRRRATCYVENGSMVVKLGSIGDATSYSDLRPVK